MNQAAINKTAVESEVLLMDRAGNSKTQVDNTSSHRVVAYLRAELNASVRRMALSEIPEKM